MTAEHTWPVRYLALGDSISIDDYTGVPGGGAASQLARRVGAAEFIDRTRDGHLAEEALQDLKSISGQADLVTVTAGGNNFLMGHSASQILDVIEQIAQKLAPWNAVVILNTIYDPTDGDDSLSEELGIPLDRRPVFQALNAGIKDIARRHGFLLADLELLFHGRGLRAGETETWYTNLIEPNHAGATAIAEHWLSLVRDRAAGRPVMP